MENPFSEALLTSVDPQYRHQDCEYFLHENWKTIMAYTNETAILIDFSNDLFVASDE